MATVVAPGADVPGRAARWRAAVGARTRRFAARAGLAVRKAAAPARAPLANLAQIPLTVAGIGCIDAAAYIGNEIAGLVVIGLSLLALEHLIADEE